MSTLIMRLRGGRSACRPPDGTPKRSYAVGSRLWGSPHSWATAFDRKPPLTTALRTLNGKRVPCMC